MKNEDSFFGRYSYTMVKLFLNQFAIGLFGAVITLALSKIGGDDESLSDTVMIVASVLATLFYMFLTYTTIWTVGAKDRISSDVGKLSVMPMRGVLISLIANVPGFVVAILYMISEFAGQTGLKLAMRVVTLFLNGMYYGFLAGAPAGAADEAKLLNYWWMYFLVLLPAIIVTGVGYYLGTRNFHLTKMLEHQYPDSDRDIKNKKD